MSGFVYGHSPNPPAHAELVEAPSGTTNGDDRGKPQRMTFWTYIVECGDGSYYVGHTDDLDKRLGQHRAGVGCAYTAKRQPVEYRWAGMFPTRDEAFAFERRLKGWSRIKKEAVIRGEWDLLPALARGRGREAAVALPDGASTSSA